MPPSIFDPPPAYVQQDLARLGVYLDDKVPDKVTDQNILIATWNIQKFGNLTKKWTAGSNDSPKRDFHSLLCIKNIIERFDRYSCSRSNGKFKSPAIYDKAVRTGMGFFNDRCKLRG